MVVIHVPCQRKQCRLENRLFYNISFNKRKNTRQQSTYRSIWKRPLSGWARYRTIIKFNNLGTNSYTFQKDIIRYITPTKTIFPENINLVSASNKSSFYYFNIIKEYIKSKENINCYFENCFGEYYNNSLIFISDTNNLPTSVSVKDITDTNVINITDKIIITSIVDTLKTNGDISETSINLGNKKIDEV